MRRGVKGSAKGDERGAGDVRVNQRRDHRVTHAGRGDARSVVKSITRNTSVSFPRIFPSRWHVASSSTSHFAVRTSRSSRWASRWKRRYSRSWGAKSDAGPARGSFSWEVRRKVPVFTRASRSRIRHLSSIPIADLPPPCFVSPRPLRFARKPFDREAPGEARRACSCVVFRGGFEN